MNMNNGEEIEDERLLHGISFKNWDWSLLCISPFMDCGGFSTGLAPSHTWPPTIR